MKILNIMLGRGYGGIEQAFMDYSNALESEGHKVFNVTSIFAKINSVFSGLKITLPNFGPWDFFSRIYLKILIIIIKPNVIIAHGRRAIKFSKFSPRVGVAHNYNIKDLLTCDYIIALTGNMKEHLIKNNYPADKIEIIPNMINLNPVVEKTLKKRTQTITIGALGRFVKKKGFDVFLQALAELKKVGYEFEAIIGGDGEEKKNLIKLANDLKISNKVKFIGHIEDKKKFFESIDIFCLPSLHEPFGIVLLEAMSFCVHIISTNTEGPREILENAKTGLLISPNSPQEITKAIIHLIDNPQIAKDLTNAAYNKLKTSYSSAVVAKKLSLFLNKILSSLRENT